jgi:sulfotransferase family protein
VHYPFDATTERELFAGAARLTVLEHHDALLDLPAAGFFAALDARYPGSRFVLTTREREAWLEAVGAHYQRLAADWDTFSPRFRAFGERITRHCYGAFPPARADFAAAFDAHEQAVATHFEDRPQALLRIDVGAGGGWSELAAFVASEEPAAPFPHVTDADEALAGDLERTVLIGERGA